MKKDLKQEFKGFNEISKIIEVDNPLEIAFQAALETFHIAIINTTRIITFSSKNKEDFVKIYDNIYDLFLDFALVIMLCDQIAENLGIDKKDLSKIQKKAMDKAKNSVESFFKTVDSKNESSVVDNV